MPGQASANGPTFSLEDDAGKIGPSCAGGKRGAMRPSPKPDTLLFTVPDTLGVDYNAHVIESILAHVAPALGWR